MATRDAALEILIQIRDDLRGITATNAGLRQMREGMAATSQAARQTAQQIDSRFGQLAQSIEQKFSAKNIGMSLLGGLGIGSAFGVINTVLGQVTAAYDAHQQKLQDIATTWKDIIKSAEEYHFSKLSSPEQVDALRAKLAELHKQHTELLTPKEIEIKTFTPGGGVLTSKATPVFGSSDELKKQAELLKEITSVAMQLEAAETRVAAANKKVGDEAKKAAEQAATALEKLREANQVTWEQMQAGYQSALAAMPVNEFQARRDAIEDMFFAGKIGAEEASKEMQKVDADYNRVTETARKHMQVWEKTFALIRGEVEPAVEEASKTATEMGFAFSSAFEDAVLSGKKLSDVLRGLARDILQIILRRTITDKIGGGISDWIQGGGMKDIFSTIFAAGGGTFLTNGPTQLTVGDNPGGAELVSVLPLSGVGTTRVSGSVAQMAGGGSLLAGALGGDTFNFSYSFGGGVSRQEIMGMLPSMVEASKAAVLDAKRRGRGGFR